jgi:Protein kinase domain/TIR domain
VVMPAASRNLRQILQQENIAGKEWEQIRRLGADIVRCLEHLHSRNILHGDLKPPNVVRDVHGKLKLIDLDASVRLGELLGLKHSSAYCPPEAIDVDADTGLPAVIQQSVLAHPSFDIWSLGVVLYEMCSGRLLFLSTNDNLDVDDLAALMAWPDALKADKLSQIPHIEARNLVSRLLTKDSTRRPSISAILSHPFISGKKAVRLVGEKPAYDVFLSYRVASDVDKIQILYDKLIATGLKVWWDKKCIEDGKRWEDEFCDGLVQSRVFVCLVSKDAVAGPFRRLTVNSPCDNVLLEHQLALELASMGLIDRIIPMFIGDVKASSGPDILFETFQWPCLDGLPDIAVRDVSDKVAAHLERQALGAPLSAKRTVQATVDMLKSYQALLLEGDTASAFDRAAASIESAVRASSQPSPRGATHGSSPRSSGGQTMRVQQLIQEVNDLTDQNQQLAGEIQRLHECNRRNIDDMEALRLRILELESKALLHS